MLSDGLGELGIAFGVFLVRFREKDVEVNGLRLAETIEQGGIVVPGPVPQSAVLLDCSVVNCNHKYVRRKLGGPVGGAPSPMSIRQPTVEPIGDA